MNEDSTIGPAQIRIHSVFEFVYGDPKTGAGAATEVDENEHMLRLWRQGKDMEREAERMLHVKRADDKDLVSLQMAARERKTEALIRSFNPLDGGTYVGSVRQWLWAVKGH